uniref:Uncharacterized protein n=1 Tax=Pristionchus pacificus TaxID=54126 RepID=A0A2A6BJE9_PRIPA
IFQVMHLPVPPVVDFGTAVVENWGDGYRNRELRHIGVIVAKTGHDRGQKEMYLYSPTVKRHDGRIVCSNDFLNFEVGDWILFHVIVQSDKQEVYIGGKKMATPLYKTAIMFDYPRMTKERCNLSQNYAYVKVRACIYPESAFNALVSRQQTHRCWSPDLGDLFIDTGKSSRPAKQTHEQIQLINTFMRDTTKLYYVTADYHFNASIFQDLGGPEEEKKVYWRIETVEGVVENPKHVHGWNHVPWGQEVAKYLEKKREEEHNFSNGVPPWYIRSTRVLTHNMLETWEEEVKTCYGKHDEKDHPVPDAYDEFGVRKPLHPSEVFKELKAKQKKKEEATQLVDPSSQLISKNSWKKVMSFDGQMLEPGSQLPPVSVKKPKAPRPVELVQDSAGLFMNEAAAQSYVEIKQKGTNKVWTTGGWKKPGEAWDAESAKGRFDKNIHKVDEIPSLRKDLIRCGSGVVQSKNLLGVIKPPPKRPVNEKSSPSTQTMSTPPSRDRPQRVSTGQTPPSSPHKLSFASASKVDTDRGSVDDLTDESDRDIDPTILNEKGRKLYDQYVKLKKYVRSAEIEAKKEPEIRGFTAREYIQSEKGFMELHEYLIKLGIGEESDARKEIAIHRKEISVYERKLEKGEVMESELVVINRSKQEDAEAKVHLIAHVKNQKDRMEKMKKELIEMKKESQC